VATVPFADRPGDAFFNAKRPEGFAAAEAVLKAAGG
jgi:hypothetical protein